MNLVNCLQHVPFRVLERSCNRGFSLGASAVCVHMPFQLHSFPASEASEGQCSLCPHAIPVTQLSCKRSLSRPVLSVSTCHSSYTAFLQARPLKACAVCVRISFHRPFQPHSFPAIVASCSQCCLCPQAIPVTDLSLKRGLSRPVLSVSVFPSIPYTSKPR